MESANGTARAFDDGLTQEQAAERLGVSPRHIQRLAAAGQIAKTTLPKKPSERTAPVFYSRADVETLAAGGKPAGKAVTVVEAQSKSIVNAGAAEVLTSIAAALALPAPQPWLSIPDAVKFSGLPAAFLRARIPELARIGAAVDVGQGTRPRWRLLRSQLERPLMVAITQ